MPTTPAARVGAAPAGDATQPRIRLELLDGKWRLLRKLGEGGMGSVYLAHDMQLDRKVAIKLLSPALAHDAELVARFEREARLTASLEHPNIVPIYAVGRAGGRPYMVMKALEGRTLAVLLRETGPLKRDAMLSLLRQLAQGIDFIHSKGFIHRDIKPANIFVGPDGNATLLDFGILRPSGAGKQTQTGLVMGTPHYMSPEQALGLQEIDRRADLYALAVVLFEACTGTLLFDGPSHLAIVQMQAHAPPPNARERADWVPSAVADVLAKGLAKSPEHRYASAAEMLAAMEAAYATPLLLVDVANLPPAEPAERSRWTRGRIWMAAVLVLALALPVLALSLSRGKSPLFVEPPLADAPEQNIAALDEPPPPAAPEEVQEGLMPEPSPMEPEPMPPKPEARAEVPMRRAPLGRSRAPAAMGNLRVVTTLKGEPYWASLWVDGQDMGTTPALLQLSSGVHTVRLERVGFQSVERQIKVAPGRGAVLRIELTP
jgi:serine/threonine-protein kinase